MALTVLYTLITETGRRPARERPEAGRQGETEIIVVHFSYTVSCTSVRAIEEGGTSMPQQRL